MVVWGPAFSWTHATFVKSFRMTEISTQLWIDICNVFNNNPIILLFKIFRISAFLSLSMPSLAQMNVEITSTEYRVAKTRTSVKSKEFYTVSFYFLHSFTAIFT